MTTVATTTRTTMTTIIASYAAGLAAGEQKVRAGACGGGHVHAQIKEC
jgi:hypothetical protein